MKLLAQSNRRYMLILLATLVVSSGVLFLGVQALFDEFTDERLVQSKDEIEAYVKLNDRLPGFFQSSSARLDIRPSVARNAPVLADTLVFNPLEQEEEPFRRLRFGLRIHDQVYQVDLLQSSVESEDIVETVLMLQLGLMAAMFAALFWMQTRLSARLWQPFYTTLERLRNFRLAQAEPLTFPSTITDEFSALNTALERLSEKTRQDYQSLKRFTENASHEIQTPLAVIQVKLETLLQSEGLKDEQLALLHSIQRAASRLSRLQQNLLLLVKIENEQFKALKQVDIKRLIENKLEQLDDFIQSKNLRVNVEGSSVLLQIDPYLAEILLSNILGNAVKHNLLQGGWLNISLQKHHLLVTNAAIAPETPPMELMERFRRSNSHTEGLGLGLSIAKEICEQYGWSLEVGFENGVWSTTIIFHQA